MHLSKVSQGEIYSVWVVSQMLSGCAKQPILLLRVPWSEWRKSLDFMNAQELAQHFTNHFPYSDYLGTTLPTLNTLSPSWVVSNNIRNSLSKSYIELQLFLCIASISYYSRRTVLYYECIPWCNSMFLIPWGQGFFLSYV